MIVSLYQTGLWAVLTFHSVTVALVAGLSLFLYGLIVESGLPKASKLAVVIVFSTIFGAMGLLVLFTSHSLLRALIHGIFKYGSATFFLMLGSPILLSSMLATYLSTIIPEDDHFQKQVTLSNGTSEC
ncbi:MAG: hypothetical protein QW057_06430 [Candidatus Bathyarchaeia archaeon]